MKTISKICLFFVFAFALVACAAPQGFVQLPDEQQAAITGLFIAGFALGFDWVIGRVAWLEFLRRYQSEWAIAAAIGFIGWLQNILPTGSEDVSIKGVGFVLALLIAVIPYRVVRKILANRGVKGFVK
jgi:hypothetical protein